jgi:MoaA/NifB/PqqE/SkfB family radical SAM enzyme
MKGAIVVPKRVNYIALFLTYRCKLRCYYCIEREAWGETVEMEVADWARWLERLDLRKTEDLPVTLQGGEPTDYVGWSEVVQHAPSEMKFHMLTNGMGVSWKEWGNVDPKRFQTPGLTFAPIRVSYHPGYSNDIAVLDAVVGLRKMGFRAGMYCVDVPSRRLGIAEMARRCMWEGVPFHTKELLTATHGTYKYPWAKDGVPKKGWVCRSNELIVSPEGLVYPCAFYMQNRINGSEKFVDGWRRCDLCGKCSYCDVKEKRDRYGKSGYSSVNLGQEMKGKVVWT